MSDIPTGLQFVDPAESDPTYRVCLFAAPGQGKSCAAASAPGPILVLSADRPSAYRFARKLHAGKDIREVRYQGPETLDAVYRYLRDGTDIKTLVIDPVGNIVDHLREVTPPRSDGDPDYEAINRKMLGFIKSLRSFDIHVVLVAHEKVNDSKKGDGGIYPQIGGMTLVNKVMAEMDIVAHMSRVIVGEGEDSDEKWVGQLQPVEMLRTKDGTNALGDRRIADLARWFEVASAELAPEPEPDLPWAEADDTSDEFALTEEQAAA